jgi:MFS family permease
MFVIILIQIRAASFFFLLGLYWNASTWGGCSHQIWWQSNYPPICACLTLCQWVLFAGIMGSSIFTLVLPICSTYFPLLLGSRVLTGNWLSSFCLHAKGFFEGVSYPCIHALVSQWIPPNHRTTVVGGIFSGA